MSKYMPQCVCPHSSEVRASAIVGGLASSPGRVRTYIYLPYGVNCTPWQIKAMPGRRVFFFFRKKKREHEITSVILGFVLFQRLTRYSLRMRS